MEYLNENEKLMKEWDYEANREVDPSHLTLGSGKKIWWKCSKGHSFLQTISKRTKRNYNCPYCSGKKALKGYNDLQTISPKLAAEWHPLKNGKLRSTDVTVGSGKRVWWKCPIGHEYQAFVRDRHEGTNCPICNLRRSTSFAEQAILYYVRKMYPQTVNKYSGCFANTMEFDVYIPDLKIAIEYDGRQWHKTKEEYQREVRKYEFCKTNGIHLIRIKEDNGQRWENVGDEIYYIPKTNRKDYHELERVLLSTLNSISGVKRCFCMVDIEKDKNEILRYLSKIDNSLSDVRPDVVSKWNYEKNGNLSPNMFTVSSNEIVWWKCPDCGNEWRSSINSMTRKGRYGCVVCSKVHKGKTFTERRVKERGSLAENMPELATEWHPTKNGDLTPYDITSGRFKRVWWLCSKCGYEWLSSPANRKKGVGCPCCSGRVPKSGINDLKTQYPELMKEWDYAKNEERPEELLGGSGHKAWWICSICGKSFLSRINSRTKGKGGFLGCPSCKRKHKIKNQN